MNDSDDVLQTSLKEFLLKYPYIKEQKSWAVAVSGGPDSMALAGALFDAASVSDQQIHIITVDHGLRVEAKAEAQSVSDWVEAQNNKNFHHQILTWEGEKPENSIMEEARHARYDLMTAYCRQHDIKTLFVGHHQGDQAETFLIRLAKGSGIYGLSGMALLYAYDEDINIARPFLSLSKQQLIDYCDYKKINFVTDSSNQNTKYLRPRLRDSMAILEKEGLTEKRLANLTARMRRAREALEIISDKAYRFCLIKQDEQSIIFDFQKIQKEPEEIAFRIVQNAVLNLRDDDYGVRMDRLEDLFNSLWFAPENFKPRTLGGLIFALRDKNTALYIKKEEV